MGKAIGWKGTEMNAKAHAVRLVLCLAAVAVAAGVGGLGTRAGLQDWYAELAKPSWTPPGWLFGPVWTVLYAAMAVAAWLVWRTAEPAVAARALTVFAIQLVLNAIWPLVFFGLRMPGAAFVEIVGLWAAVLVTVIVFWRSVPAAALLMVPYLCWVTFAAALNLAVWRMNA